MTPGSRPLDARRIETLLSRLAEGTSVRSRMPGWGMLHIDRPLPFLTVYRRPQHPDPGTDRLVVSSAAHLRIDTQAVPNDRITALVTALARQGAQHFGAYLLLEIWAGDEAEPTLDGQVTRPAFVIHAPVDDELDKTVVELERGLSAVQISGRPATVDTVRGGRADSARVDHALITADDRHRLGVDAIGIEVRPIYRNGEELYPLVLRAMRRQVARTLYKTCYEFVCERTPLQPSHYFQIGRRSLVKAVYEADHALAEVSDAFDLLLQVTPVNLERAWKRFSDENFERPPAFRYRPLPADPDDLKRALYAVRLERIEDPTLIHLFLDKRDELDRMLTMLRDIGTRRFRYGSLQLHGTVGPSLAEEARRILAHTSNTSRQSTGPRLDAREFAALADAEIAAYREQADGFDGAVEIRDDLYAGLLSSHGRLLVSNDLAVPEHRAQALIQHEIGTHLLTYYNGGLQPFRLLHAGLPGYDALQEGLAVLAEYLVGGLDAGRLRTLAARVVCVEAMIDRADFVEAFRLLKDEYGFSAHSAFTITARVYRAGGFAKDKMYLEGLLSLLGYVQNDGDYEQLLVGKFATAHVPMVRELAMRGVLEPMRFRPPYLDNEDSRARLARIRSGIDLLDMLEA